ncbi:hypothetical protein JSY13_04285 [Microbacterium neungamense]|nr:hypothetical protein [Microbacterium neungamense]UWF78779.1 hypothetical protein JSY13_04285 [Microbacterium neungamense]
MKPKQAQPSVDRPRIEFSASGVRSGKKRSTTTTRAVEDTQVWMPYQAVAVVALIMLGMFAPYMPNAGRHSAANAIPYFWPPRPARLVRK